MIQIVLNEIDLQILTWRIFVAVEQILGRENAGKFAKFSVEVRLIGIAGFRAMSIQRPEARVDTVSKGLFEVLRLECKREG